MLHGTCVTHVPCCMLRWLISGFLWSQWRVKRSRHSWRIRNPQFFVSGKRPMHQSKNRMYAACIFLWVVCGIEVRHTQYHEYSDDVSDKCLIQARWKENGNWYNTHFLRTLGLVVFMRYAGYGTWGAKTQTELYFYISHIKNGLDKSTDINRW